MRTAKQQRPLARFTHPVKIEIRQAVITPLKSVAQLDIGKLERAARAEVELGYIEGGCCRQLVRAIVRKGMVTDLAVEPCPETMSRRAGPELVRLLKVAQRRARAAAGGRRPTLPTPVAAFLGNLALSVKGLSCFEICLFGWCIACCTRTDIDADWICGKLTIDTTTGPYPDPE